MRGAASGKFELRNGRFEGDPGMIEIDRRINSMQLLLDRDEGRPSFYVDADGCYWQLDEHEDYRKELRPVDAEYILSNYPTVDLGRTI
jgi:hypothetical protein